MYGGAPGLREPTDPNSDACDGVGGALPHRRVKTAPARRARRCGGGDWGMRARKRVSPTPRTVETELSSEMTDLGCHA